MRGPKATAEQVLYTTRAVKGTLRASGAWLQVPSNHLLRYLRTCQLMIYDRIEHAPHPTAALCGSYRIAYMVHQGQLAYKKPKLWCSESRHTSKIIMHNVLWINTYPIRCEMILLRCFAWCHQLVTFMLFTCSWWVMFGTWTGTDRNSWAATSRGIHFSSSHTLQREQYTCLVLWYHVINKNYMS